MKNLLRAVVLTLAGGLGTLLPLSSTAQSLTASEKARRPSPPAMAAAQTAAGKVVIRYSRPAVKGRRIFGSLVPYGQVWRTGANEATTFHVDHPVRVQGRELPAGTYSLFTIPGEQTWTIIFNKVAQQWGAYEYLPEQDVLRVQVAAKKAPRPMERLLFHIDASGRVALLWEQTEVDFLVSKAR